MSVRIRLAVLLLLTTTFVVRLEAGANSIALIIRGLDPPDYFLVDKFKINDKDEPCRLSATAPLGKKQYENLPKMSLGEVHWFRVEGGVLRARAHTRADLLALPCNFKWKVYPGWVSNRPAARHCDQTTWRA